jgi:hypothetical protein
VQIDEIDTEDFEGDTWLSECGKSLVMTGADRLGVANDDDDGDRR